MTAVARSAARNTGRAVGAGVFRPALLLESLPTAVRKLDPRHQVRNPVMFVVWVGSVLVTVAAVLDPSVFAWWIAVWLWFTVVFANLAEAVAEGRGRAQADALRATRTDTVAQSARGPGGPGDGPARRRPRRRRGRADDPRRRRDRRGHRHRRRVGDHRRVRAGGARVRRRLLLGHRRNHRALRPHRRTDHREARRVVRRPDDRAGRGRAAPEDAERDRADDPALSADDRVPARRRGPAADGRRTPGPSSRWWCWWRCWSASSRPPSARCSRRSASPGWTGSCSATCWRRRAVRSRPPATCRRCCSTRPGRSPSATGARWRCTRGRGRRRRASPTAARRASLADTTPEGRSIVALGAQEHGLPAEASAHEALAEFVPFSATTRMSGVDLDGRELRKGATSSVLAWLGDAVSDAERAELERLSREIAERGGTPLVVASSVSDLPGYSRKITRVRSGSSSCRTSSSPGSRSGSASCGRWASRPS